MIIVVDSGATKADWRIVDGDGKTVRRVLTDGMNVSAMERSAIERIILSFRLGEASGEISAIHFYTAGLVTDEVKSWLVPALQRIAPAAGVEVQTDLVGSARAACGHRRGVAAILGTGSNSCLYDGEKITMKVNSGGFIIGDEGGAAALGRIFLADLIKGLVPEEIVKDLEETGFDTSYGSIVENIYHSKGSPSGYLGSLAPFLISHYANPYVKGIVDANFKAFIDRCLLRFDTEKYPVGIIGGFGNACRDIFTPLAKAAGVHIREYIPDPVEGLIRYHCGL
ncbi:MAG: hypothetical protein IKP46_09110 [Bacteroidales bacterium]|nr:hypothetical protein [Bacteroidales bacterium]